MASPGPNPGTTTKTEAVFISLDVGAAKINYAYTMPHATYTDLNTDLGITKITNQTSLFYGVNAPKPWRATKTTETATGITTKSSFCSTDKIASLRPKPEYNLQAPKGSLKISGNPNITTVCISIPAATGTVKYLWNMKTDVYNLVKTDLGIQKATKADLNDAIRGMSSPSLPTATKKISGVGRTTFVDPTKLDDAAAKGWTIENGTIVVV
jgi:hypothetical protein